MTNMVMVVAVGPVQQFIGQARRMRDLWFGSHLLSEMSRAAARSLVIDGWSLVFPALDAHDEELDPCNGIRRPQTGEAPMGIANKVVAIHGTAGHAVAMQSASNARLAALGRWETFAEQAVKRAGRLLAPNLGDHESPIGVVRSFLEIMAGWSSYAAEGDFDFARDNAEQAIAARKHLRDFRPWPGAPYRKSSLDGQRESVLIDRQSGAQRPADVVAQLRISDQEHLDGIGIVKRGGGDPEQFVPVARIAIEPWLRALDHAVLHSAALHERFRSLEAQCRAHGLQRLQPGATRWLRGGFPYDGELFFEGQWPALEKELGLKRLCEDFVKPLFRRPFSIPAPYAYVACLHADGDRMGRALAVLRTAARQSELSRILAEFSGGVREIVEDHGGLQVYAGGDDILAVLPVSHAVGCAEALRSAFVKRMRRLFLDLTDGDPTNMPTLSVGIGIAHVLKPLRTLLGLAREAERLAKDGEGLAPDDPGQRNALAIIVDKRSGDTTRWRGQWPDATSHLGESRGFRPGERLQRLTELLSEQGMPSKLPYELADVLASMAEELRARNDPNDRIAGRAWRLEVQRIVGRKRPEGASGRTLDPSDLELDLPAADDAQLGRVRDALAEWVGAAKIAAALVDADVNRKLVERRGIALERQHEG